MVTTLAKKAVVYPESDGKPMGETEIHVNEIVNLLVMLREWFRKNSRAYVASNLFLYYQEGDPRKRVAPDIMVVLGVEKRVRRIYKLWEEGKGPDVVIEVTSRSTRWRDLQFKKRLYQRLGVAEYYLYDPTGDYLPELLRGYHLEKSRYRLAAAAGGRWRSPRLGLDLAIEAGRLRLYDPETGRWRLTPEEQARAQERAEADRTRAEADRAREAQARRAAEVELQRLREELARLRKSPP